MPKDYIAVNLANWNSRVPFHEQGYGLDTYRKDATHLSKCVRFDLPHLGDVSGLRRAPERALGLPARRDGCRRARRIPTP